MGPPPDPDQPLEMAGPSALQELGILGTGPEESFDRIAAIAAALFHVPIVQIGFFHDHARWLKAAIGVPLSVMPREQTLCQHAADADGTLVIADARENPAFRALPAVAGPTGVRFYAGTPIRMPEGTVVGTLCIADTIVRDLSAQEQALLKISRKPWFPNWCCAGRPAVWPTISGIAPAWPRSWSAPSAASRTC